MPDVFNHSRRASINDRVRLDCTVSRSPNRQRSETAVEAALAKLAAERGDIVSQAFWAVAVAAEPIAIGTVCEMLEACDNATVAKIRDEISALITAGLIEFVPGNPTVYVVCRKWWLDLRTWGGHYCA